MFRRAALQQLQAYRNNEWPEDYDLFLRADAAGLKMGKPEPVLLRWREHQNPSDPYGSALQTRTVHARQDTLPGAASSERPVCNYLGSRAHGTVDV